VEAYPLTDDETSSGLRLGADRYDDVADYVTALQAAVRTHRQLSDEDVLEIEIDRRRLYNVTLVRKAVWHEPTTVELQVSDFSDRNKLKDSQTYSPRQSPENYEREKKVPADSIDNIVDEAEVETVDHVHITISGAEIEAIQEMSETLEIPGFRLFVRTILRHKEEDIPINRKVARMLEKRGLKTTLAKREPDRGNGGNVYAWRPE